MKFLTVASNKKKNPEKKRKMKKIRNILPHVDFSCLTKLAKRIFRKKCFYMFLYCITVYTIQVFDAVVCLLLCF